MLELIKQRLKSKTYWTAIIGALLTILEANSGYISGLLPPDTGKYLVLFWVPAMLTLREITTAALSDK
jgi:uncharacterized membrane protein